MPRQFSLFQTICRLAGGVFGRLPKRPSARLMLPLEGNCWMLTLGGRHADKPPRDPDGFLVYAQQLRTSTIYNAIKRAKQVGKVARFGFPASVWRHFEQVKPFPRGLLPIGDAICRFNPVYGQGMSVAAQEALLLHQLLRRLSWRRLSLVARAR